MSYCNPKELECWWSENKTKLKISESSRCGWVYKISEQTCTFTVTDLCESTCLMCCPWTSYLLNHYGSKEADYWGHAFYESLVWSTWITVYAKDMSLHDLKGSNQLIEPVELMRLFFFLFFFFSHFRAILITKGKDKQIWTS